MNRLAIEISKLQQARKSNSFVPLIGYPKLLWMWQVSHEDALMPIARIASHRLGNHKLCEDKCILIDKWIRKALIQNLVWSLEIRQKMGFQERLFNGNVAE